MQERTMGSPSVVFEASAEGPHTSGAKGRGNGVARMGLIGFTVEAEGDPLISVDMFA
jgi:hypothetical protein